MDTVPEESRALVLTPQYSSSIWEFGPIRGRQRAWRAQIGHLDVRDNFVGVRVAHLVPRAGLAAGVGEQPIPSAAPLQDVHAGVVVNGRGVEEERAVQAVHPLIIHEVVNPGQVVVIRSPLLHDRPQGQAVVVEIRPRGDENVVARAGLELVAAEAADQDVPAVCVEADASDWFSVACKNAFSLCCVATHPTPLDTSRNESNVCRN